MIDVCIMAVNFAKLMVKTASLIMKFYKVGWRIAPNPPIGWRIAPGPSINKIHRC